MIKQYSMVPFYHLSVPYGTILQCNNTRAHSAHNHEVRCGTILQSKSTIRYYLKNVKVLYGTIPKTTWARAGTNAAAAFVPVYNHKVLDGTILQSRSTLWYYFTM